MVFNTVPQAVVVDPINSFVIGSNEIEAKLMLIRLIDYLKLHKVTGFFTNLTAAGNALEHTDVSISSSIDTWLLLKDIEIGGERNRGMYILKSRGMKHSNQIREFLLTDHGVELLDVYVGQEGVLTGSARLAQEAKENADRLLSQQEIQRKQLEVDRNQKTLEAKIAVLKAEFETNKAEALKVIDIEKMKSERLDEDRKAMSMSRKADPPAKTNRNEQRNIKP